jgi:hypothetical protein
MIWTRTHLGLPTVPDLIAVSGRELIAFPDLAQGDASPPCVRCSQAKDIGGVTAGHLSSDVRAELLVALQDPAGVANAEVAFFSAASIALDDRGTCFASGSPSRLPGRSPDFGDLIVVVISTPTASRRSRSRCEATGPRCVPDMTVSGPGGRRSRWSRQRHRRRSACRSRSVTSTATDAPISSSAIPTRD